MWRWEAAKQRAPLNNHKSSFLGGLLTLQKKGGLTMYITYEDLIQLGIFVVALVGLCYEIFKGKGK
ncbi:hypothetical protein [Clostridium sp. AN503]|uniref:hypothetical protein n=1 Tax=Clostridium sp. AN503 TaxID=3160598 RepID=UPI00345932C2